MEGSISKTNEGFLLDGPEMNHSRIGDTPPKFVFEKGVVIWEDTGVGENLG